MHKYDSLAEWSKAPDLGSGPKGRGFKSHSCQFRFFFFSFFVGLSHVILGCVPSLQLGLYLNLSSICVFEGITLVSGPMKARMTETLKLGKLILSIK